MAAGNPITDLDCSNGGGTVLDPPDNGIQSPDVEQVLRLLYTLPDDKVLSSSRLGLVSNFQTDPPAHSPISAAEAGFGHPVSGSPP